MKNQHKNKLKFLFILSAIAINGCVIQAAQVPIESLINKKEQEPVERKVGKSTALHKAVKEGKGVDLLSFLIESGEEVNALDEKGKTALEYAKKETPVYDFIKSKGGIAMSIAKLFEMVIQANRKGIAAEFIKGADLSLQNNEGQGVLHVVTDFATAKFLAAQDKRKIAINRQDSKGRTPLRYHIENGNNDVAKLFLKAGATFRGSANAIECVSAEEQKTEDSDLERLLNDESDEEIDDALKLLNSEAQEEIKGKKTMLHKAIEEKKSVEILEFLVGYIGVYMHALDV